jgi:hypothetical protein
MKRISNWMLRGVAASAVALFGAGTTSANQFVGDLVYCEVGGERGVYEPEAGDYGLDGVEVSVHCTDGTGAVCDLTTTTGGFHSSVDVGTFNSNCSAFSTFDITDPAQRTGRYAFNLLGPGACPVTFRHPVSCTIAVNPETLPADCDALVSPTVTPELPEDGNGDGDYCDAADDGPFVEGQILGDNGADQATCEAAPSIPGDGVHEYHSNNPPSSTRCSVFDDFAFEKDEPECVPCVPRKHTCHKKGKHNKHSYRGGYEDPHEGIPTCPAGVGSDPKRTYSPTTTNPTNPPVTYCPVDDDDDDDHGHGHGHGHHNKPKHKKHWGWGPWHWGWGWGWR